MTNCNTSFYGIRTATLQKIEDMISRSILSVIDGGILSEFESRGAAFFGNRFGVATCNGTAAIHSALFAIDLAPGDEVILPSYGFLAMLTPILQLGGKPVFCEVYPDSLTIDVEHAASLITPRTRAVLILHPWGNPAHMDKLRQLTLDRNIFLISDSSHAHGAQWKGRPLGALCDLLCASFGFGKLISGGELGIATTDDASLRDRMLLFGHLNRVPDAYITDRYKHLENSVGIKYRPHAFALQLALDQLETFSERNHELILNIQSVIAELHDAGLATQAEFPESSRVYWKIVVKGEPSQLREVSSAARSANLPLEPNHYFSPLHESSIALNFYGLSPCSLPATETLKTRILQIDALRLHQPDLTEAYRAMARSYRKKHHAESALAESLPEG